MTVDLRVNRTLVLTRSTAARLRQLAERAPDSQTRDRLLQGVKVLNDTAAQLEKRLHDIVAREPSYPLGSRGNGHVQRHS